MLPTGFVGSKYALVAVVVKETFAVSQYFLKLCSLEMRHIEGFSPLLD